MSIFLRVEVKGVFYFDIFLKNFKDTLDFYQDISYNSFVINHYLYLTYKVVEKYIRKLLTARRFYGIISVKLKIASHF